MNPAYSLILLLLSVCSTPLFAQLPVEMLIVGGGGGGGRNAGTYSSGGGGASGGQVTFSTTNFSLGEELTVTVGSGGFGYRNNPLVNQTNGNPSSISGTSGTWTAIGGNAGSNGEDWSVSGDGGASVNADLSGAGGRGGIYEFGNTTEGWPEIGGDGTVTYSDWGAATVTGELVSGFYYYGGGGAGGNWGGQNGAGVARSGYGGGGRSNTDALENTGGGGGGANSNGSSGYDLPGGNGGSGIVIIRYAGIPNATGGIITESDGYTYHTFLGSGTFTVNAVLPVNWLEFSATKVKGAVLLTWKVAAEKNNQGFDIERSNDGLNYTRITSINGSGNPTLTSQYTYTDNKPLPGRAYYRIKQIDKDGRFTYSNVAPVDPDNLAVQLGPNPFKDQLQISLPAGSGAYELRVSNLQGAVLYSRKLSGSATLSLPYLTSGLYIFTLWKEGHCVYTNRLFK